MRREERITSLFQDAIHHHEAGHLGEAASLYRDILSIEPSHSDVLSLLGMIASERGEFEKAGNLLERAIAIDGQNAGYHWTLGNVLVDQGKLAEAVTSYRQAIAIRPEYPEAHFNLGNVFMDRGQLDEAIACYRQAITIEPVYAEAFNNLGNALSIHGKLDEAISCFRQAIDINPTRAATYFNVANTLRDKKQFGEAIACYQQAIAIDPAYAVAYNNLGNVFRDEGKIDDAVASLRRAIQIDPAYAYAHNNLGSAFRDQGKLDDAVACHQRAIEINPKFVEAHYNLGNALQMQDKLDEAITRYQKTLALNPGYAAALSQCVSCLNRACRWDLAKTYGSDLISRCHQSNFDGATFPLLCIVDDPAIALTAAKSYREHKVGSGVPALYKVTRHPRTKVRLAYLSADFREHPTSYLTAELFERHDRSQFELHAISFGPDDLSLTRKRLVGSFDQFIDVRKLSDRAAAQKIRDLEIDIAIDLMGYTRNSRESILAFRPAPIQVNYLGYPGTMGAEFIDYIVVDPFVVPTEQQQFFTERLVHLPDCYQVNDTRRAIVHRTPSRRECGLPESGFVFCSFNNTNKITPEMFGIWMRLLRSVSGSVLWLFGENKFAEENLRKEAQARDTNPNRLVFAPRIDLPEHLARYHLADIFLDTLPYNAHTTASDALWMGVPVVTCAGLGFPARVAGSLLRAIGLPDLITHSLEEYEAVALKLAVQPRKLATVKAKLQENRSTSPLFNTDRFRRHLEAAYRRMWENWQSGGKPTAFAVPAESD